MAAALDEAVKNMQENMIAVSALRDKVVSKVLQIDGAELTGTPVHRLPGIASFLFRGFTNPVIVAELNKVGICASSGSACSSGSTELTRSVEQASDREPKPLLDKNRVALRLSFNECNTEEDIDYNTQRLPMVLATLR
jgi:cysteine desulfurase